MGVGARFFLAGERPSWNALAALLLILTGLALARWLKPTRKPAITSPSPTGPRP
jgi:drug/metabolite transporter (DMT)-like permease